MKKVLQALLGMVIGAAIGYGGIMLLVWMTDDGSTVASPKSEGVDWLKLVLTIGLTFVWMAVAVVVQVIMHEAGHLVAGLLTGFRFVSFRIFKFTLVKTPEGRLTWKRYHIAGTGGQCILVLPADQDVASAPWFWYNAGGVMMNLLLTVLSVVLLRLFHPGVVVFSLLAMMAFVGFFMALMNGIPHTMGGVSNDGNNLWLLWRKPAERRFFVRSLQIVGQLNRGRRISELPRAWVEDCPVDAHSDFFVLSNRGIYMMLLEDEGRYDEARQVAEELMSLGKKLPQLLHMETGGERVMLELLTTCRRDVVAELWTKPLARYTVASSKYSPVKNAVLYAYELLYNHDAEKAEEWRLQFEHCKDDYAIPGETLLAAKLMADVSLASSTGV